MIIYYIKQYKEMSDEEMSDEEMSDEEMSDKEMSAKEMSDKEMSDKEMSDKDNAYVNQITLNFLISKNQLQKLNKLKLKEEVLEPEYDKKRIFTLFNQLANNERPDDLLEDVKTCFDAFIEKSIYYLEMHDKNEIIQNELTTSVSDEEDIKNDIDFEEEEDIKDDIDFEEEEDIKEDIDFEEEEKEVVKPYIKYSKKKSVSNGVEDIHKLPVDWFNSARQNYKINQIIPRKKEIVIDNTVIKKKYN
jgi:hypothetical protein